MFVYSGGAHPKNGATFSLSMKKEKTNEKPYIFADFVKSWNESDRQFTLCKADMCKNFIFELWIK